MKNASGFTMIELVMVIVILGALSIVAVPRYLDMKKEAAEAAEEGVVGAVRAGIHAYRMNRILSGGIGNRINPPYLDNAWGTGDASLSKPFFAYVLSKGITDENWNKAAFNRYHFKRTGNTYTYDNRSGSFNK